MQSPVLRSGGTVDAFTPQLASPRKGRGHSALSGTQTAAPQFGQGSPQCPSMETARQTVRPVSKGRKRSDNQPPGTEASVSLLGVQISTGGRSNPCSRSAFCMYEIDKRKPLIQLGPRRPVLAASARAGAGGMQAEVVRTGGEAPAPPSFSVTPPIPAGPDDLFEDATAKAGSISSSSSATTRIANIIESNGSGIVVFDYDNDGYMDSSSPIPARWQA
jgi:hypothetical protein